MDIRKMFLKYGADNITIMEYLRPVRTAMGLIAYTSSNDEPIKVPCKIIESRYDVADGYKIEIESIYDNFGKKSYYQSDLNTLMKMKQIEVLIGSDAVEKV